MATTPIFAFRYPILGDAPNVPAAVQNLATDVENRIALASAAAGSALISTAQTTASNTFADLATVGPTVTVTVGPLGIAIVSWGFEKGDGGGIRPFTMHYAVSGANVIAATLTKAIAIISAESDIQINGVDVLTGLTPGSTTFTAKYTNQFSGTAVTFKERKLGVVTF